MKAVRRRNRSRRRRRRRRRSRRRRRRRRLNLESGGATGRGERRGRDFSVRASGMNRLAATLQSSLPTLHSTLWIDKPMQKVIVELIDIGRDWQTFDRTAGCSPPVLKVSAA